jgi:photosystem II stability/assembly factor-like uncharacterized protein
LLQWGEGADGVEVVLAVPDPKAVQYLYDTYGRMHIKGWLQPVYRPVPTIPMPVPAVINAPSGTVIWVSIWGYLFRSTDRGNTWEQRALPPIQTGGNPDMSFLNAEEGWVLIGGADQPQCFEGRAQIWHTTDGAATWRQVAIEGWNLSFTSDSIGGETCKEGISFSDPLHGYISAWGGNRHPVVYRTLDGGRNWTGATLTDPPGFVTQMGSNLRLGVVKGFSGTLLVPAFSSQGDEYIFRSIDSGATWTYLAKTDAGPNRVTFVTSTRWIRLLPALETTDSGSSWHVFASDYTQAAGVAPDVIFGDSRVGYATVRGSIQRTVDGGAHWEMVKTPGT